MEAVNAVKQAIGLGVKPEKPIKLYSHAGGPNPWKVAIILSELQIPYTSEVKDFPSLKQSPFIDSFPNGRVPAIEDPNTGIKLWESGAIIEYLLETYDTSKSLSYTSSPQKFEEKQWLHFQMSGQGPYFGQRAWFQFYHPEKIQSCLDRYGGEIRRVLGVIDRHLKQTGGQYLVGDRVSYADLAFVPWHWLLNYKPFAMGEDFPHEWQKEYPLTWEWSKRLEERPAVAKVRDERFKAMNAGH